MGSEAAVPSINQPITSLAVEFRVGTVLRRSLDILRRNIVPFGILSLLVGSLTLYIDLSGIETSPLGIPQLTSGPTYILAYISNLLLTFILTGILVHASVQDIRGRISMSRSIIHGLARSRTVIGINICFGIAVAAGLVVFVIPGIIIFTLSWVTIPVAVVEDAGVFASFGRSQFLTKGHRWGLIGLSLLVFVPSIGLFIILGLIFGLATDDPDPTVPLAFVAWIVTSMLFAFFAVTTGVGYYYLRSEKEGVGVEETAAVFD